MYRAVRWIIYLQDIGSISTKGSMIHVKQQWYGTGKCRSQPLIQNIISFGCRELFFCSLVIMQLPTVVRHTRCCCFSCYRIYPPHIFSDPSGAEDQRRKRNIRVCGLLFCLVVEAAGYSTAVSCCRFFRREHVGGDLTPPPKETEVSGENINRKFCFALRAAAGNTSCVRLVSL